MLLEQNATLEVNAGITPQLFFLLTLFCLLIPTYKCTHIYV